MESPQLEILVQANVENADSAFALGRHCLPVVIHMVLHEGPARINAEFPMRYGYRSGDFRPGYLLEVVVPLVVVRVIMLLVVFRLVERGSEMCIERHRALAVAAERIQVETYIGIELKVVDFLSEEGVVRVGVPVEVVAELAFRAAVDVGGVPDGVAALRFQVAVRREHVVVQELVADSDIDGRYDGVRGPRLELQEHFVLELHYPQRVGGRVRIQVELIVVQFFSVGIVHADLVFVYLPIDGIFAGVPDERGGDIGVQSVRSGLLVAHFLLLGQQFFHLHDCQAVPRSEDAVAVHVFAFQDFAFLHVADERERNPVCLVQENGVFLYQCRCVFQSDVDFPGAHRGVPDPEIVNDTSVFAARHLVVYVSGVHEVSAAHVVRGCDEGPVVRLFVFEHAVGTEAVVLQCEVQ